MTAPARHVAVTEVRSLADLDGLEVHLTVKRGQPGELIVGDRPKVADVPGDVRAALMAWLGMVVVDVNVAVTEELLDRLNNGGMPLASFRAPRDAVTLIFADAEGNRTSCPLELHSETGQVDWQS